MVVLEACNNFVIPFFVFKHSLLKSFVPGRVLKFWCVYPLSLSLLLRRVSSCKCLDLKFGSLVYHSRNWGCCRSNMLCPQEESVLLLGGFLAAFLANPWEGLHWTSEEEALGCTLKVFGESNTAVSYFSVSSYAFLHRPCFFQQMGRIITLWTMFYL